MLETQDDRSARDRRILFVSSTMDGGSGRSQRELAAALADRGCAVRFLVEDESAGAVARRLLEEFTDATVRFRDRAIGRVVDDVRGRLGRRTRTLTRDGLVHDLTLAPENAAADVMDEFRPSIVVASSISRVTWRAVRKECRRRRVPTVLYFREPEAVGHLTAGLSADLLVANSHTLVADAGRHGVKAELVPSVVRVAPAPTPPTREVALLVNPIASRGVDIVGSLAAARPDIPIVLQESWLLDPVQQAEVDRVVAANANVTFRAYEPDAGRIFRDARILLVPHRVDNRPRTVLEAQVNSIPSVASDHPGLVEAVGEGGVLIDREARGDEWASVVGSLWDDREELMRLGGLALRHATRVEVDPERVVDRFEELVEDLVVSSTNHLAG